MNSIAEQKQSLYEFGCKTEAISVYIRLQNKSNLCMNSVAKQKQSLYEFGCKTKAIAE